MRDRIKQRDHEGRAPDRNDREVRCGEQMCKRGKAPFVDIRERGDRRWNGQHMQEGCNKVGSEVGALVGQPDGYAADAARLPCDRADRDIGPALEGRRPPLRQVGKPRENGGTKAAQARRRIRNELAPGTASAGLLEGDHRLACQHRRLARDHAVEPRPQVIVRSDRNAGAKLFKGGDGAEPMLASEFGLRILLQNVAQQHPLRGARSRPGLLERLVLRARRSEDRTPSAHWRKPCCRKPWPNTRLAKGRRFADDSSVRHTSSSPRT